MWGTDTLEDGGPRLSGSALQLRPELQRLHPKEDGADDASTIPQELLGIGGGLR